MVVLLIAVVVALLVDVIVLLAVLVAFKVVVTNTPNPTMKIIAITTRLITPREAALFAFANVRPH
jgi:hypothetical protein